MYFDVLCICNSSKSTSSVVFCIHLSSSPHSSRFFLLLQLIATGSSLRTSVISTFDYRLLLQITLRSPNVIVDVSSSLVVIWICHLSFCLKTVIYSELKNVLCSIKIMKCNCISIDGFICFYHFYFAWFSAILNCFAKKWRAAKWKIFQFFTVLGSDTCCHLSLDSVWIYLLICQFLIQWISHFEFWSVSNR